MESRLTSNSIRLAGAAWSWVGASLQESAAIYRAIGVNALDLIAIPGSRLDTYEIAADPSAQARRLKDLDVEFSNLLVFFGTDFRDRALNSPDPAIRSNNCDTFCRLLEFCAAAGFHSITVLPGVEHQSVVRQDVLACTASELNHMNELANAAGVLLVYEPHVESILENPRDVLTFANSQCDVKLVIDYSHAVSMGYPASDVDPLLAYAGHVHLRQAAPDKIQARWEEGTIDFPALIASLKQTGYQGYLTLEYEHDKFWQMDRCDVMTETIRMRDVALRSLTS
jgi:sugar phosphate isomerase/epimerase